jgi:hypothetical protein
MELGAVVPISSAVYYLYGKVMDRLPGGKPSSDTPA